MTWQKGFSLVEVLVAMSFIAIVMLGVLEYELNSLSGARQRYYRVLAAARMSCVPGKP